jgi:signal transduction histidine kinase
MATSVAGHAGRSRRSEDPRLVSVYCVAVSGVYMALLVTLIALNWTPAISDLSPMGLWLVAILFSDMMRVRLWDDLGFALSLPVTLAAAMVLDPWQASLVAFLGSVDLREIKGEIPAARSLFNRAEVGLCVLVASAAFHAAGGDPSLWPRVIPAAMFAFAVDLSVNVGLVLLPVALLHGSDVPGVLRRMIGDRPSRTIMVYLSLGVMAPLMALLFELAGATAVVAFAAPLALAWATFREGQRAHQAAMEVEAKNRALLAVNERIAEERRFERLELASALHDEVLPALFRVHLLGQVLRQDLERGRLLDLEEDAAGVTEAANHAQETMRRYLTGLRVSQIGHESLEATVRLSARDLEGESDLRFDLRLEPISASQGSQLLAYQVAREAMANAARHSAGTLVVVRIYQEESIVRVSVADDGVGFELRSVDLNGHFGLGLLRERLEAAGGHLVVDSGLGRGTTIAASLPAGL